MLCGAVRERRGGHRSASLSDACDRQIFEDKARREAARPSPPAVALKSGDGGGKAAPGEEEPAAGGGDEGGGAKPDGAEGEAGGAGGCVMTIRVMTIRDT